MDRLVEILVSVAREHPVIASVTATVVFLGLLFWRRVNAIPPVRIDRKILRFMHHGLSKNRRMTTSSLYAGFVDTPVSVLDRSIERLVTMEYIDAAETDPFFYEVNSLTEKGNRAARAYWWIPW